MSDTPNTASLPGRSAAVITVGTFDGVHLGHRDLLRRVVARARERGLRSVVVTFHPHPLEVVNPTAAPLLLTVGEEKVEMLVDTGVDYVVVLPFTPTLASYSAPHFVRELLVRRYRLAELWIGYDHGLGRGREGDLKLLRELGVRTGFSVDVVAPVVADDGAPISSTAIRRAIAYGELDRAALSLGRPYSFRGEVVRGAGRGRTLGYPTLNIAVPSDRKLFPPEGVYAVRAQTAGGIFGGMMNLGPRPTFGEVALTREVHLFDVAGDWYGQGVSVEFVSRLRDVMTFSGKGALEEQLARDARGARCALTELRVPLNLTGSTE